MEYESFVKNIKKTLSPYEEFRKAAMTDLKKFWESDRGKKFTQYRERMYRDFCRYHKGKTL